MDDALKKTLRENKDKIISVIVLITVLIVVMSLHKEEVPKKATTTTTQSTQDKKRQEEQERIQRERSKQDAYGQLLDTGKTYEQMSSDERINADGLVDFWSDLDPTFKSKYQTQKDTLSSNRTSYLKAETEKAEAKKREENRASYDTGITYDQLARTPDNYKGQKAKFTGKVIQVLEDNGQTDLRLVINGNYDTILYVTYSSSIISSRILENDNVTVRGVSQGLYTYKATLGNKISIPLLKVDEIVVNK